MKGGIYLTRVTAAHCEVTRRYCDILTLKPTL